MSKDEVQNDLQIPWKDERKRDLVEVVRCKDCVLNRVCRFGQFLGLNGFCSHGERRNEAR